MTTPSKDEAARLIEEFLVANPSPDPADWKRLIDSHPLAAGEIADAAIAWGSADSAEDDHADAPVENALFDTLISGVLNRVHQRRNPLLDTARQRVATIQGPAARKVAVEIGIGDHVSLLNGILVGRTAPPARIIAALARRVGLPAAVLMELFSRSFQQSEVPAFKSPDGLPKLLTEPVSWDHAVRALRLPAEETERLLRLADPE